MRSTFKILFYIKKNAIKSNGQVPVMARITVNGEIAQFSLKCDVNPADWNSKAGRAIGKSASDIRLCSLQDLFVVRQGFQYNRPARFRTNLHRQQCPKL